MKVIVGVFLAATLACVLTFWATAKAKMKDEYTYTLWVNNALFMQGDSASEELSGKLNNMLYVHLNRYLVYRSRLPGVLHSTEDELICHALFSQSDENWRVYKELLVKEGLYDYILTKFDYCPGSGRRS